MADARSLRYPDPVLEDEQVVLRAWTLNDLRCIEEASSDPAITEATTVPETYTPEEGRAFITRQWNRQADAEGLSLAIADQSDGRARGLVVLLLRPEEGTLGIGYWIVPTGRGSNRATRAVRLLSRWALTNPGIDRLEALVEPENAASIGVLEACRFQSEGVLRSHLALRTGRADAIRFLLKSADLTDG